MEAWGEDGDRNISITGILRKNIHNRASNIMQYPSFVCLFDLILYVPSTVFQLNRDGSSWVEPVLS